MISNLILLQLQASRARAALTARREVVEEVELSMMLSSSAAPTNGRLPRRSPTGLDVTFSSEESETLDWILSSPSTPRSDHTASRL